MTELSNFLFGGIYVVSVAACIFYVWLGGKGIRGDYTNAYYDTGLIPGVAGFAIFPVMNTAIAITLTWWVYLRSQSHSAKGQA